MYRTRRERHLVRTRHATQVDRYLCDVHYVEAWLEQITRDRCVEIHQRNRYFKTRVKPDWGYTYYDAEPELLPAFLKYKQAKRDLHDPAYE